MTIKMSLTKKILLGTVIALVLLGVSAGFATMVLPKEAKVVRGIQIREVQLGNLTRLEAQDKVDFLRENLEEATVKIVYGEQSWEFKARDLGLKIDVDKILNKAMEYGHQGNFIEQFKERRRIAKTGQEINLYYTVDRNQLHQYLNAIAKNLRKAPKNASWRLKSDDTFEITPGINGTDLDFSTPYEKFVKIIEEQLDPVIELQLLTVEPETTTEDVKNMKLNGLVSSFSTTFSLAKANRSDNIRVATRPFRYVVVKPGEVISFNKVVGPRSTQNGFKTAPVILKGKLVDGLGGGVCQVSTTLFNAVLYANLEIVQRSNHTIPVHYVPVGRDATVAYGAVDFKFKNNTDGYLLIKSFVYGDTVTFKIYGDRAHRKDVVVTNQTTATIPNTKVEYENDPTIPKGTTKVKDPGGPGYRAVAYRIVRENGKVVKREKIASSYYKPQVKVIAVGTGKPKPQPKPATDPAPTPAPQTTPATP